MNQLSLIHFLPEQRIQELHIQLIKGIRWVTSSFEGNHQEPENDPYQTI